MANAYGQPENFQTTRAHDPVKPVMNEEDLRKLAEKSRGDNSYDKEEYKRRLRQVQEWRKQSVSALADARQEMIDDHEYYDGYQWDKEDKRDLEERGQDAVVFNQIAPAVDWILGTERKQRIDFHVLPRTKDDAEGAKSKTKLLKYVSDVSRISELRSQAFEDAAISGLGWLEAGARSDATEDPIFVAYEDWRNIWYDPLAQKKDLSDGRYIFRAKWVDLDTAMTMFPERADKIRAAAYRGRTYFDEDREEHLSSDVDSLEAEVGEASTRAVDNARSRIQLIECWYRVPARVQVMRGRALGVLDGEIYDSKDSNLSWLIEMGHASLYDAVKHRVRCMIYAGDVILQDGPSPYRHNRFPFIPIWGKRRKRDNTPYGVVRNLKSPQEDLNKRRSKALYILATNKIIADDDATDDWEEFWDEATRPDGILKKRRDSQVEIHNDIQLADAHTQLMDQDSMYIQDASGVTNENLGRDTNATSGRAILAKQQEGRTVVNRLFDNHLNAYQTLGEILLSLVEQFYDDEKEIRISGKKGNAEWLEINKPRGDGTLENDILANKADFIVSEQEYHDSLRQAMFETMSEMVTKLDPEMGIKLLDMVVELSDMVGKEEMVQRIREINGMPDPYADPDDPEEAQRMQQRQQQEEMQARLEREQAIAETEQAKAEARKLHAEIQQTYFEAQKTRYEAILEMAKVDSERANQEATRAGISFDEMKLRLEKAQTLKSIRNEQEGQELTKSKEKRGQGPYREKGLKSNNKQRVS